MCCGCSAGCGSIVYVMEKLASFLALTAVVICIMVTIAISLGLGIGLGYNHCFVDLKVETNVDKTTPSALRDKNFDMSDQMVRRQNEGYRRNQPTTVAPRTIEMPPIKHTMAIPLHGQIDFPMLLSKLRNRNKNITLELIT